MALLHEPSVLILDEPTAGVDATTRARLLDAVAEIASRGVGVLYATHYFAEVDTIGQDLVLLNQGTVAASGAIEEVLDQASVDTVERLFMKVCGGPGAAGGTVQ